jgi:UDP-glucose 4-epimerase
MRIAVTGGSGFIGRATLAAAHRAGHTAWPFDASHGGDVLGDLSGLADAGAVVHLAGVLGTAELFEQPENAVQVNVVGALRVLQWCVSHDAHYIGITMPPVFPSVYTATKIAADRLASAFHHAYGLRVSHVRAFNAYGPGQAHGPGHPQKILPTFATEAWADRPIPVWGSGMQFVDLVHADDIGRMLVDAVECGGDDAVFDAGTGQPVSVLELAGYTLDITGSQGGIRRLPMRRGEVETAIRARGEGWDRLGWKPEFDWNRIASAVRSYRPPSRPGGIGTAHGVTAGTGPVQP